MATEKPRAATRHAEQAERADSSLSERRDTLVMVRWALIMACAYLILFSERSSGAWGLGVIGAFLASNLLLGRLPVERLRSPQFISLGVGAADSVLIASSLYLAGQLSVELLVLFLGILVLAIAGLRLATIATVTLGMTLAYMGMVWLTGSTSPWQSSVLLRAPFLLGAALLYASLADSGAAREDEKGRTRFAAADTVSHELRLQLDAIGRCQRATSEGASGEIRSCLEEIATCNQAMQRTIGATQLPLSQAPATSPAARSAA